MSTVTAECAQGILPADTVSIIGSYNQLLYSVSSSLYVFPSMNFSCNGTITDTRMSMEFLSSFIIHPMVYFLLFHDGLNSQPGLVRSLLVVSLLLSAVVGGEGESSDLEVVACGRFVCHYIATVYV